MQIHEARAALPSNDAYLDAYCAAPSKWYSLSKNSITKFSGYQSEYARVKKCKMSERTRHLQGEKKKTLGDYFVDAWTQNLWNSAKNIPCQSIVQFPWPNSMRTFPKFITSNA